MERRVGDPRILPVIQKWLKADVMEEGKWLEPKTGSSQGSVIQKSFFFDRNYSLGGESMRGVTQMAILSTSAIMGRRSPRQVEAVVTSP